MAMPSGNVVAQDKMQFPSGGGGGAGAGSGSAGGEIHYRQQWFVDERDSLIGWLRSEFAAANAIIDSLCHHLRIVGDPGEYDMVVGAIQQRRCNWNQVLLMQQYFSVSEVVYALQQVAWRRQQRYVEPVKVGAKEVRKSGPGYRHGQRFESAKEGFNASVESYSHEANIAITGAPEKGTPLTEKGEELKSAGKVGKIDDKSLASTEEKKADAIAKNQTEGNLKGSGSSQGSLPNSDSEAVVVNDGLASNYKGNESLSIQNQNQSQSLSTLAKTFVGNEMFDGTMVNVADGLKLYEELFDGTEVSKLVSLVNDLRISGKRGHFQGSQTFVVSRRPMKGHGREMIQLGVPVVDAPLEGENMTGASREKNVEPIPSLFREIIERMVASQVMTVKPDACVVDFFNEGDHSQPYNWPHWFGRPVHVLFLTECEITFGRVITTDHPGDYRGTLKLSLSPGSFLAMQGKCTDFAKYAIPSFRKQRILVTFIKSQPRRSPPSDAQRLASPAVSSHWGPPPSRSPNHMRHHVGPKHYPAGQTTGVLPAPPIRPQIPPPNGMQPLFVAAPVVSAMPFPAPVPIAPASTGWTAAPPRHPTPRIPAPGTGVFLPPPGSGNPPPQVLGALTEVNPGSETPTTYEKENGNSNHNNTTSPKGKVQRQECNGHVNGTEEEKAVETEQDSNDKTVESQ
ncbi:RNA demethylase ALKBH10B isoform X1 [Arachis hypogaea]|uniref:RNA demethylase ALKBH10B isoform X1 n=1 Tax=Arachis hypogaea TaxID=3818 RepID=UPI000DED2DFA|nr:RNA demethylase ALKBH10B isoform X1 [Arachis hypogaea]